MDLIMANETIKEKAVNGQNLRDFRNFIVDEFETRVMFVEYINENTLKSDTTRPNGTIGYEDATHKFFIYCSPLEQWIEFAQGNDNKGFPYSFNINFIN